ncbi:hypothetical protein EW145_g5209 [Phellinidium pouzarii]|uniref:Zn(2)-C6 fungal-type domain-containing protein n=1 Tax=Phellinidium pouzarii TaxID=167371 RepID=A0A4S4L0T0_9AGAM|nr:hypothetical protein EW145_g5209 [Phellinidium pouzarii]
MSSGEEDINDGVGGQESKKRRIQRACDTCRRKKSDAGQMPSSRCSNCSAYNLECTYVEAAKKRGPPKGYVESLENRLENMEKLLQRLCPDADFTQELGAHIDRDSWSNDKRPLNNMMASRESRQNSPNRRLPPSGVVASSGPSPFCDPDDLAPSDDELVHSTLTEGLKRLAVDPLDRRFHGKSSGVMLVQAAMNLKQEFSGSDSLKGQLIPPTRRTELWSPHPWEIISEVEVVQYHYPPDDLIPQLVDKYFTTLNPYLPILHRPSFERALADYRHHTDIGYGSVVMLVCSLGARASNDPRCLLDDTSKHSAGWKWFDQVQVHRKSFMGPPRLYDLQIYALSALFLQSSSSPQSSWTMVGIGIRLAQDVGAHRRKVYNAPLSVESELWKRAFWVLVALDRFGSAALGRPCAIQDEDFDLDLPLEVDDEYWENPDANKAFKQPPGIPCVISFFNSFLKLNQILAFALRTIYSINKSKILLGFVGPQWEQHIVAELDSALNKWIDTVPDHLRWDPHRENLLHFNQSATLYATYYHLQILIHRPFIPSPRKPSPLTFPSLAICTNAARSCSHVTDTCRRRGSLPLPQMQIAAFTSGIVLLLNIWGAKKSGTFIDSSNQMADVHKCMQVLRTIEERFISAGRLWDILNELACAGDIPVDKGTPPSNKRERGADSPVPNPSPDLSQMSVPSMSDNTRPVAGRRSIGTTASGLSPQVPLAGSSSNAGAGGLPYGTEQLAHTKPELVHGSDNVSLPWMPSQPSSSSALGTGDVNSGNLSQESIFTSSAMPNLNIFDLFQSDPFNESMMEQGFMSSAPQGSRGDSKFGQSMDASGNITEEYGQLDGSMASVDEALQMWSSAPTSFE